MKLIGRNIATWLIAVAIVLIVIDGTKTLGEQRVVITSIGAAWTTIEQIALRPNGEKGNATVAPQGTWPQGTWPQGTWPQGTWPQGTWPQGTWPQGTWAPFIVPLGGLPGWLVFGLPGLMVALASRRNRRRYNGIDHV